MTIFDTIGLILSFVFVFAAIGLADFIYKRKLLSPFATRKIIHISVAHWWLMAMFMFSSLRTAIVGPIFFIIFNFVSLKFKLVKAMEAERDNSNWGTVLFPVSLLIMVILCWSLWMPFWIGAAGILVLGWGDGLASLVGRRYGQSKIPVFDGKKSWLGSISLAVAASIVVAVILAVFSSASVLTLLLIALLTGLTAAIVELFTPFNLDNLSLPFAVALLLQAFYLGGWL